MKEGCPFRYSQITQVGKIKLSRKSKLKTNHMEALKGLTEKSLLSVVSLYGTVTCLASYFFLFQRTKMTAWTEVAGENRTADKCTHRCSCTKEFICSNEMKNSETLAVYTFLFF